MWHIDARKKKEADKDKTFVPGEVAAAPMAETTMLTEEEQTKIMEQIEAATSYEEIQELEKRLLAGTGGA